jgi:hypothetical protein
MSESFHVNMSYSGSVVLTEKFFNDLAKFSHFYDNLPFEEDLALYLNNLKFPLPKDDLCQVWLKLPAGSGEDFFFRYKQKWIWFSLLWPLPIPANHDLKKLKSRLYQKAFM